MVVRLIIAVLFICMLYTPFCKGNETSTDVYMRAVTLMRSGERDRAIVLFRKVIKMSPYFTLGHYGLGKAYLYSPDTVEEAVTELRQAVKLDKKLSKGYFYLGLAYYFNENYKESARAFHTAFRLNPSLVQALYNLSSVYDLMGRDYHAHYYYKLYKEYMRKKSSPDLF